MFAETYYLVRHAILLDAASRLMPPAEAAARQAWAQEAMKHGLFGDGQEAYAEQLARYTQFAGTAQSPGTARAISDLEVHYLNVAWRRAIREHRIPEALVLVERMTSLADIALHDRVEALIKTSVALRLDQRPQLAAEHAARARELAESPGQRAWATQELGNAFNTSRRVEEADEMYQQALHLARDCGEDRLHAAVLCNLGSIRRQQGRGDEALLLLDEAVRIGRECGAADYQGTAHLHLGFLHGMAGRTKQARENLQAAIEVLENTGKEIFRVDACYHLADVAHRDGDTAAAEQHVEVALAAARRIGYRTGLTQALNIAAMLHDAAGRGDDALAALREAVSVARESGDHLNAAVGLTNLGFALLRADRLEEAEDSFSAGEEAAEIGRNTYAAGFAAGGLGDVRRKRGRLIDAWVTYERAIQLLEIAGVKPGVVRMRAKLAGVMAESGEVEPAITQLHECIASATHMGLQEELEIAETELAKAQAHRTRRP